VTKKLTVLLLSGLFSWSALFGVSGGLLLCLHDDLSVHIEAEEASTVNCIEAEASCTCSMFEEDHCSSCWDVELDGDELPHMLPKDDLLVELPEYRELNSEFSFLSSDRNALMHFSMACYPSEKTGIEPVSMAISRTVILRL